MTVKNTFNPDLEAARAKARELAAAAPAAQPEAWPPKKVKPPKPLRVQFLVRLTEPAREAIRKAAWRAELSEQEFIEQYALSLPKPQ